MMEIESTEIIDFKIIHISQFKDNRGIFSKVFQSDFFRDNKIQINIKEAFYSISNKNVIRGMHFQVFPYQNTKIVYLSKGSILDVVLDIRDESKTYGKFVPIELNEKSPKILCIPPGCAHGFLTLRSYSVVNYLQTSNFYEEFDKGININSFGMIWPIDSPIVSERDKKFPGFNEQKFKFI